MEYRLVGEEIDLFSDFSAAGNQMFVEGERHLGGSAVKMLTHDARVERIQGSLFGLPGKKIIGIPHEILIQCVFTSNQYHGGFACPSAHPAAALPGSHDGARIADQYAEIEITNIDSQFKCRRGDNSVQLA